MGMRGFKHIWTSHPARAAVRVIARLFPTWFHEKTWPCGEQESLVRRELFQKAQSRPNARTMTEAIQRTHELLLTLLNQHHGGLTLEEHVPSPTVRCFSQLYTIILVLLCFRQGTQDRGLREDLAAICREPHLVEVTWSTMAGLEQDELAQANRIWDECLQVLGGDSISQLPFFRGFFVILANRTAAELR